MKSLLELLYHPEVNTLIPTTELKPGYVYKWSESSIPWVFTGGKKDLFWGINFYHINNPSCSYAGARHTFSTESVRLVTYIGYQTLTEEQIKNCPSRK